MNLGAFMNPEFPIFSTTLCYLEREDAYLMLHRIKKQDDYNHDKWIGVGGKFERFESPEDCLLREVKEETGLTLKRFRARGLLTFIWGNMTEFIHLYTADGWQGEMVQGDACKEGVLEWVPKEKVTELLSTFEEKQMLEAWANDETGEDKEHAIQVYIGEESPVESMKDCSVVTATYQIKEGVYGKIGIVGPKRMDYEKVVGTLEGCMQQLDDIFKKKIE